VTCDGAVVQGASVTLRRPYVGTTSTRAIALTADAAGLYRFSEVLGTSVDYRGVWSGDSTCVSGALSAARRAGVKVKVTIATADATLVRGQRATITGRVYAPHPGKKVTLQRVLSTGITNIATVTLDSSSAYRFTYTRSIAGSVTFRVRFLAQDTNHLANVSGNLRVSWS
jgi:hypothetical protein